MTVLARNLEVPGGEIDIVARDGATRVAVEVRTIRGGNDPIDAIDEAKRARVEGLASRAGVRRVDLIGVAVDAHGIDIHWLPGEVHG